MVSPFSHLTIASFLGAEFAERKQRNSSYSLRAFARDIGLSPSRLSEVLKGEQGISEKSAEQIADKIKLKARERQFWKDLILAESSRSQRVRELAQTRMIEQRKSERYRKLHEDQFRVMSDWHHSAILEMILFQEINGRPQNEIEEILSKRLGFPPRTIREAIERLVSLQLLKKSKANQWSSHPEAIGAFSETPSATIRKFHRNILNMHMSSLMEDSMDEREFTSMILALPKSKLEEVRKGIRDFVTGFWQKYEEVEEKDTLFSFGIQLCPVKNRN